MKNNLSPEDCKKVEAFLAKIRPMIKTGDVRIEQTEKNILFDKKYTIVQEYNIINPCDIARYSEDMAKRQYC